MKINRMIKPFLGSLLVLGVLMACQTNSEVSPTTTTTDLPSVFKKFNSTVQISLDGNYVVIKSDGIPDHKSPYFGKTDARYEAYNGTNTKFQINPNSIQTQSLTFRIPLNPTKAASSSATPLGPIGVALNGVPFFNQYAGPNQPLTNEINSFDQYGGHPQQTGQYHYHVEPLYLTKTKGTSVLLGFLLDGFPVYGPTENGKLVANSDLDAYHGHFHATEDYPNGIYHYHITAQDPYINGSGFYGTAGTVSK
ncbi:MAG: YHYH protein [Spirosomataceae bacterium]